jgi:hypothetical protein
MKFVKLTLLFFLLVFFSCTNKLDHGGREKLKKRVWSKSVYNNDLLVNKSIHKIEHFNAEGILVVDTIMFDSGSGFEVNTYSRGLRISSLIALNSNDIYSSTATYDSLGNMLEMINVTGTDTTLVKFESTINNNGLVDQIIARTAQDRLLTTFSYNDSLMIEKDTYRVSEEGGQTLLSSEKRYFDKRSFLTSVVLRDLENNRVDSTAFINNNSGDALKEIKYMNGNLVSSKAVKIIGGEEVFEIIFQGDSTRTVFSSESYFY